MLHGCSKWQGVVSCSRRPLPPHLVPALTGPLPPHPLLPQLPCFGYGKPLDSLRARFRPELTPSQAAAYMKGLILGAYDKWTTG